MREWANFSGQRRDFNRPHSKRTAGSRRHAFVLAAFLPTSLAAAGTISFENFAGTGFPSPGAYTSLALNDGAGVTATLTRTGSGANAKFDVAAIPVNWGLPASWGQKVLNPFHYYYQPNPVSGPDDMFRVDFASPGKIVTSVTIDYGDYYDPNASPPGGDAHFEAYNASGVLIGSLTQYWNGNLGVGEFGTFTFNSATPISYIRFWGEDDPGNNTLFWDNLTIRSSPLVVVPLPTAMSLGLALMGSVGGLGFIRRRVCAAES